MARYRPPETLSARFEFEDEVKEPCRTGPVIDMLARRLEKKLAGRAACRLVLTATSGALAFPAVRVPSAPLSEAGSIGRLARLALEGSGAEPLGIDALEIGLSGLGRPALQPGLWPRKAEVAAAVAGVGRRFPDALLDIRTDNPHALAAEQGYVMAGVTDGKQREAPIKARPAEPAGAIPLPQAVPG